MEQCPVTEERARQTFEYASRGRNLTEGIALWGVLNGRRPGLDYAFVSLATGLALSYD
jgi:hypothetical protein